MGNETGTLINFVLSALTKKIRVPYGFHERVGVIKSMLDDDVSGLVDSLTDFAVNTACVNFSIETKSEKFTKILTKWLDTVNSEYKGKIPSGIKPLSKEYFKERWKSSSLPVLKIAKWGKVGNIIVPTKMIFVDGGSIYAKDKKESNKNLELFSYDYYLGKNSKDKLDKNVIITKPYGRWFDKYPTPYLIKRGVYHNWKIIQSLKNKESEILNQIIPYLLLVKKGTEGLELSKDISYTKEQLTEVLEEFKGLMKKIKIPTDGVPARATNYDEEIKHLIPDLSTIFNPDLFTVAEKNILSGLGFIDIAEAVSASRRESILNPKVFIEETKSGIEDFKQILKELILLIKVKNETHVKYINSEFYITASPIKAFIDDKFRNQMRLLWERGQLSNQTYAEIVGDVEYRTEVSRRKKEAKRGDEYTMYPHLRENKEEVGIDIVGEKPIKKDTDKKGNPIPTDKIDDKDKYNIGMKKAIVKCDYCQNIFDMLKETESHMGAVKCPQCGREVTQKDLITAPYKTIKELPNNVKKKLSPSKQKAWMKIFNNAYKFYLKKLKDVDKAESIAFRIAWEKIKQVKN